MRCEAVDLTLACAYAWTPTTREPYCAAHRIYGVAATGCPYDHSGNGTIYRAWWATAVQPQAPVKREMFA